MNPIDRLNPIRARRGHFFFSMSIALLLLVLIGFAPTFYLRALLPAPPIRWHLYVHGAILTGWFVWLVVQTWLVRAGRIRQHRTMGIVGSVLAAAVTGAALLATLNVVRGIRAAGFTLDQDISVTGLAGLGSDLTIGSFISDVVWINFASVAAFTCLVAAAVLLRNRAESHKRLMLLASICLIGPALARISRIPGFGGEQGPLVPAVTMLLLVAMIVNDLVATRRVKLATALGVSFVLAVGAAGVALGGSDFGRALVDEMQ